MAAEEGFAIGFEVWNQRFERKDDRNAAKEEYEKKEKDKLPDCDVRGRGEGMPGNNSAKIDEHGRVEEKI